MLYNQKAAVSISKYTLEEVYGRVYSFSSFPSLLSLLSFSEAVSPLANFP
jgi:hypothetical protein